MKTITKLSMALALCTMAGVAAADTGDSSMNPYTGDSWAALQGNGHNLGAREGQVTVRIRKQARVEPSTEAPTEAPTVAQAKKGFDFGHHRPAPSPREMDPV